MRATRGRAAAAALLSLVAGFVGLQASGSAGAADGAVESVLRGAQPRLTLSRAEPVLGSDVTATVHLPLSGGTLVLEHEVDGRWTEVRRVETTERAVTVGVPVATMASSGRWRARLSTGWLPGPGLTTNTALMTVRTAYSPAGEASSTRVGDSRWNPCAPIRYAVNTRQAPASARAEVRAAVAEIHRVTGLDLVDVGTTGLVPQTSTTRLGLSSTGEPVDLVIAWATPQESDMLRAEHGGDGAFGTTLTTAYGTDAGLRDPDGTPTGWIVQGRVVMNAAEDHLLADGFGPLRPTAQTQDRRGTVLLHELGHVVGLRDVHDRTQVMDAGGGVLADRSPGRFGAGDLAGLQRVGATRGCVTTPTGAVAGSYSGPAGVR